jgi:dihydropteroate synthase
MKCCRELDITSAGKLKEIFQRIGVNPTGSELMLPKGLFRTVYIKNLTPVSANILKQESLAVGGECALHCHSITHKTDKTDALVMATEEQFKRLIRNVQIQPFGISTLGKDIDELLFGEDVKRVHLAYDTILDLSEKTAVMGILNLTPDSFSDGGCYPDQDTALKRAEEMIDEGADIIDIGGESTRPGAEEVSVNEELDRVIPVVEALKKSVPVLSVDTAKPEVAEAALKAGAHMINDIFGFRKEPRMAEVVAAYQAGAVLMHIQGTPRTMQNGPHYDDLTGEIINDLDESIRIAGNAGLARDHLMIDPGIGFGKSLRHNLNILRDLKEFKALKVPVMVGASRKSFIGNIDGSHVTDRLGGSLAAAITSILHGASIVRVHDVKETVQAVKIIDEMKRDKS